eukprot:TRINITY_DN5458_c0_g1_i1.p1 TRINITY_DN5458_c0_g1~~TRINITY_DN5458_c0_g1_i1.p1  ORF type:complete len:343 (-),score=89.55 TRINITY_DN5458_c0_g1_i1:44-1072(-)
MVSASQAESSPNTSQSNPTEENHSKEDKMKNVKEEAKKVKLNLSKKASESASDKSLIDNSYPIIMEQPYEEDKSEYPIDDRAIPKADVNNQLNASFKEGTENLMIQEDYANCVEDYLKGVEADEAQNNEREVSSAIKVQAAFRSHRARRNYKTHKEIRVIRSEYKSGKEKLMVLIYLNKEVIDFEFISCRGNKVVYSQKCLCLNDVDISKLRSCWMQTIKESKGEIPGDVNKLIEQINSQIGEPDESDDDNTLTQIKSMELSKCYIENLIEDSNNIIADNGKDNLEKSNEKLANDSLLDSIEIPYENISSKEQIYKQISLINDESLSSIQSKSFKHPDSANT